MKIILKSILTTSLVTSMLVACSTPKPIAKTDAPVVKDTTEQNQAPADDSLSQQNNQDADTDVTKDANSVFFDFDRRDVDSSYNPNNKVVITSNVDYLEAHAHAKVLIAGNTDSVGSPEYNKVLGRKRALAVKNALVSAGILKSRVKMVSYGAEKPIVNNDRSDTVHNAPNRRADIYYTTSDKPSGYNVVTLNGAQLPKISTSGTQEASAEQANN